MYRKRIKLATFTYWICGNFPFSHKGFCRSMQFSFQQIIMNVNIKPTTRKGNPTKKKKHKFSKFSTAKMNWNPLKQNSECTYILSASQLLCAMLFRSWNTKTKEWRINNCYCLQVSHPLHQIPHKNSIIKTCLVPKKPQ